MRRNWLAGPLRTAAGGSAGSAAAAVVLAVAIPHDAVLVYVPQAIGSGLVAVGLASVAHGLADDIGPSRELAWLHRPANLLAVGYGLYAFGWCWLAVSYRGARPVLLIGTAIGAAGAVVTASAIGWAARRIPSNAGQSRTIVSPPLDTNAPSKHDGAGRRASGLARSAAPLVRAAIWVGALCVLSVAVTALIVGSAGARVIGGFLLLASLALARFLYKTRPRPEESAFDRMQA